MLSSLVFKIKSIPQFHFTSHVKWSLRYSVIEAYLAKATNCKKGLGQAE